MLFSFYSGYPTHQQAVFTMVAAPQRDLITIGRSSVDLYGQQVGGRLEDMASFAKSVGGSPANIAIGAARLGLKAGFITRVGDEQMGRFIREQLEREGVALDGVTTDPQRLTALVILGVRDDRSFPHIFYRTDCADMAIGEEDIDEAYVSSAAAVVVTGTHFSTPTVAAASSKAVRAAKAAGRKVIFDIDYRPNLWGLAGHDAGEARYVRSAEVTRRLDQVIGETDLIVGTEEELMIAGGVEAPFDAVARIRTLTEATIVLKQGPMGCVVFDGPIPERIEDGIRGPGFPVEVYNTLGAGDAFMAGFLRGWLRDEPIETCCAWANACGAIAVSRLLCSTEYPTFDELQVFLCRQGGTAVLRHDAELNHVHWAETRRPQPATLMALAIDHRAQFEALADRLGAPRERIGAFKTLAVEAAAEVAGGRPGFGMLIDGTYGTRALYRAAGYPFWIGRPVEQPGSRPLDIEGGGDLGAHLVEWPLIQTVKCLCFYHPDDSDELKARQERELIRVFDAARTVGRELMIEIIAGTIGSCGDDTVARILKRLYGLGIRPDWWKLEPQSTQQAWSNIDRVIEASDRRCRGVVLLGLEAPEEELARNFEIAVGSRYVRGFAVGRTIFFDAATAWLEGRIGDTEAIAAMATRFRRLVSAWEEADRKTRAA
jgi:5-dehydro-2-deoxygluconokinase